jgi:hypothetical protein
MNNTLNLFQKLNANLIELILDLSWVQWNKDTAHRNWKVKDIASQILYDIRYNLPSLSNGFESNPVQLNTSEDFSADSLIAELQFLQEQINSYTSDNTIIGDQLSAGRPAGSQIDIFKFYAQIWLYQQQIRQSLGVSLLLDFNFYHPFLAYCFHFLPSHFKNFHSPVGTLISIEVVGDSRGMWSLIRRDHCWELSVQHEHSDAQVYIDQNIAWILFSGGIDIYEAAQYWQVIGNQELGRHVLSLRPFVEIGFKNGA